MSSNRSDNRMKIWGLAVVAGVIAFFALKLLAAYTTGPALLLAILIAILVAILLWIGFYEGDEDTGASAETASMTQSAAPASQESASVAAAPAPEAPKPAKDGKETAQALLGEAGSAMVSEKKQAAQKKAAKPAAKKTAAKKPAAKTAAAAKKSTSAAKAPARKPVAKDGKPETLKKARASGADDLKMIKGVGPGLEKTLNELGFYHYDQIAGWRKKEVEWVDSRLKFKGRIERDEWIKQAKVLAKGGTTEFSKRAKY